MIIIKYKHLSNTEEGQVLSYKIYGNEISWITYLCFVVGGYLMNIIFKYIYEKMEN